jgi:hypothetical protein
MGSTSAALLLGRQAIYEMLPLARTDLLGSRIMLDLEIAQKRHGAPSTVL